jgi:predicted dehydrogenase
MNKTFRWGLIGPGRIAHNFAKGLATVPDGKLQAVASRDAARAIAFATEYGGAKCYDSYDALIADPEVDAIYIATPHNLHADAVRACIEGGKPVLCEKPLTVNAAQAEALFALAKARGVFLMEALWTRFLPIYAEVRKWLDEGRIGEPRLLSSSFGFKTARNVEDRLLNPALAGGALLDIGVYNLSVSQWVLQRNPDSFSATGFVGETGVDEQLAGTLDYGSGVMSQFHCTIRADTANDFRIYGSEGSIRIHSMFWGATMATLQDANGETTLERPHRASGFEYQIEEAQRCIREGLLESPGITHADTLATMKLMDALRRHMGQRYPFEV